MFMKRAIIILAILLILNTLCGIGALPAQGSTNFYGPTCAGDVIVIAQGQRTCDTGSRADVSFYVTADDNSPANFITDCGCLPLGGPDYELDCAVPRGTIPDGVYHSKFDVGYTSLNDFFTVTHAQTTSTAPAPTSTITNTDTSFTTTTTISTSGVATSYTVSQVTVPSSTSVSEATVTPTPSTTTITVARTYTRHVNKFTATRVTKTVTAPCISNLPPCGGTRKAAKHAARELEGRTNLSDHDLERRQMACNPNAASDGPATVTTTPAEVYSTTTSTSTSTVTQTSVIPSSATTSTIVNTVFSGITTSLTTATLPAKTITSTRHTQTVTVITTTHTITQTVMTRTTPVCNVKTAH